MLRLALLSGRGRLGTFAGALVALFVSSAVLVMAGGMMLEAALRNHPPVERYAAAAAVVTGRQVVGAERRRPRRARSGRRRAREPPGRRPRRPGRDPRRLGARPARRPRRRRPRVEQRCADALRAARRTPARRARRGRHRLPRRARLAAASGVHGSRAGPSPSSASRAPRHPVRRQAAVFLTDREAARLAGHPGRADAIGVLAAPGFDASRLRAAAGGAAVLTGARAAGPSTPSCAGADDADRRRRVVRRDRAVHRPVRRGRHDGPVDPAARARDRAAARGRGHARPDPAHDRLGGGDHRSGGLGGGHLARRGPRAQARARARAPRHRPAELRGHTPAGCRSRRRSAAASWRRCSPCSPPAGAPPGCRPRAR